jgi:hypothetical protein
VKITQKHVVDEHQKKLKTKWDEKKVREKKVYPIYRGFFLPD